MKSARNILVSMGMLFLGFGLLLMGISFGRWQSMQILMETGISTQGELISVGKGNTRVGYEAEGQDWVLESSVYSSDMEVGDQVTVWYMPGEPGNVQIEHWAIWGVWLILGGTFFTIGAGFLAVMLPKILIRRSLMANGVHVTAQVTEVYFARWIRINRTNPYIIHAVCTHPYTRREMKVKSEYLMEDPRPHIRDNEVSVLVDPMRDHRYCMLTEEIRA